MSQPIPPQPCPSCTAQLRAASDLDDPAATPGIGTFLICTFCTAILIVYAAPCRVRLATDDELNRLPDKDFTRLVDARGAAAAVLAANEIRREATNP